MGSRHRGDSCVGPETVFTAGLLDRNSAALRGHPSGIGSPSCWRSWSLRSAMSGTTALVKPYAVLPLASVLGGRIGCGGGGLPHRAVAAPVAGRFSRGHEISATISRQSHGDSTFGLPPLMAVAVA